MIIRELTSTDFDAYSNLRSRALDKFPENFSATNKEETHYRKARFDATMNHAHNFMLGAFENDILVGFAGFVKENRIKLKHKGLIWGMFVSPKYQGKGIGGKLLQQVVEKAFQTEEIKQLHLGVIATNANAYKLYLKNGFVPYGEEKNALFANGKYFNEILMLREKQV